MDNNANGDIQKLGELIKGIRVAMLTTIDDEGCLHSRPMAGQDNVFDGTLWFFTEANSEKVHELQRDRHVNLSYADPGDSRYVSVSGAASISRDREKMKELWSPLHKAWFPKGLDDPNIALLRVEVDKAEYWDSPSSAVVRLFGFAKALATGKRYGEEGTDHEKLSL
jgi:general stress protein 26